MRVQANACMCVWCMHTHTCGYPCLCMHRGQRSLPTCPALDLISSKHFFFLAAKELQRSFRVYPTLLRSQACRSPCLARYTMLEPELRSSKLHEGSYLHGHLCSLFHLGCPLDMDFTSTPQCRALGRHSPAYSRPFICLSVYLSFICL